MDVVLRSLLVALALVLAGALVFGRMRRGPHLASAEKPAPAVAPAPSDPLVRPGAHALTALFPALDVGGRRWGYIDASGAFVIAPQYASAGEFSDDLAFVVRATDGRLVAIDKNNHERLELVNPSPTGWLAPEGGFQEGFALVVLQGTGTGNRYTYVDARGVLLGPPRFWPARPSSSCMSTAGSMMICRLWTMTLCAAASQPCIALLP